MARSRINCDWSKSENWCRLQHFLSCFRWVGGIHSWIFSHSTTIHDPFISIHICTSSWFDIDRPEEHEGKLSVAYVQVNLCYLCCLKSKQYFSISASHSSEHYAMYILCYALLCDVMYIYWQGWRQTWKCNVNLCRHDCYEVSLITHRIIQNESLSGTNLESTLWWTWPPSTALTMCSPMWGRWENEPRSKMSMI